MRTIEELLKEFPGYRATTYHVDMKNVITPIYTHYDRVDLEDMLLDRENSGRMQLELF